MTRTHAQALVEMLVRHTHTQKKKIKKKKIGELEQLHAEVMPNSAAEAQLHHLKLRLQYFIQVA